MKNTLFLCLLLFSFTVCIGQDKKESKKQSKELFRAIKENNILTVTQLITQGVNVNQLRVYQTPLYYAVYKNKVEIVKLLLDNGANVNYGVPEMGDSNSLLFDDGWSPLQCAALMGRTEIVKLLLEKEPNIDAIMKIRNQTALDMAIQKQNTEIINLIREARKNQLGDIPEREYHSFDTVGAFLNLINATHDIIDKKTGSQASTLNSSLSTSATCQTQTAFTNCDSYLREYQNQRNLCNNAYQSYTTNKISSSNQALRTSLLKSVRDTQKLMRSIRDRAAKNGCTIPIAGEESLQ